MDWIVNWITNTVSTAFHSFIVDVIQYIIATKLLEYIEELNDQINSLLENGKIIKDLLDFFTRFIHETLVSSSI